MKEIIIDGANVAECSYYNKDNYPYCCEIWDNECEAQLCYYKQLKRLEQENEILKTQYNCYACGNCKGKEDYKNLEKHHIGLRKVYDELRAENEKLKQINEDIKTRTMCITCEKELQNCNLRIENEKLKEQVENFKKMFEEQFEYKEINLKKIEKLKEEIKQLTEWKRKSVTCQECYDEGVATADIKINRYKQALEEVRELCIRQDLNQGSRPRQILKVVNEVLK